MTWDRIAGLALAAVFGLGSVARAEDALEAPSGERIAALVKDLSSDQSAAREKATKELKAIGKPALPALRDAAKSDDPEVAWRARAVIGHIEGKGARSEAKRTEPGHSRLQSFSFNFAPDTTASSVQIAQGADGRITVKVTEEEGGKSTTRTYEAGSAEEFKEKYPEVAKRYGIGEASQAPRVLRDFVPQPRVWRRWGLDEDFFDRDWPGDLSRDMEELHERMRRSLDDVFRRHGLDLWEERVPRRFWGRGPSNEDKPRARDRAEGEERAESPAPRKAPREADRPAGSPATLGVRVSEVIPALRGHLKLGREEGILVEEVLPDGPAARAGFKAHDVIVAVNGATVKGVWELRRVLREAADKDPDGTLSIAIIRDGERQTLQATLRK